MKLLLGEERTWREVTCLRPLEMTLAAARQGPATAAPPKSAQQLGLGAGCDSPACIHHGRLHPALARPHPKALVGEHSGDHSTATATMSSGDESAQDVSSDNETPQQSRAASRLQSQMPGTPGTPRKRRRIESVEPSRVRKYYLEGKYNDAYRVLFNEHVSQAAARFEREDGPQHYTTQYGVSTWTGTEQAALFAALERLGKDDVAGVAHAVGTKSITETHELLLLLKDAAATKGDMGLTLRHVPAAIEVGQECNDELDVMAEALAWYQEQWEVNEERERYGDHWLITPSIAAEIENAINGSSRAVSTQPATPIEPGTPRTGPGIAGYVHPDSAGMARANLTAAPANAANATRYAAIEKSPALTVRGRKERLCASTSLSNGSTTQSTSRRSRPTRSMKQRQPC